MVTFRRVKGKENVLENHVAYGGVLVPRCCYKIPKQRDLEEGIINFGSLFQSILMGKVWWKKQLT
jgi:hypothetical protein